MSVGPPQLTLPLGWSHLPPETVALPRAVPQCCRVPRQAPTSFGVARRLAPRAVAIVLAWALPEELPAVLRRLAELDRGTLDAVITVGGYAAGLAVVGLNTAPRTCA